MAKSLFFFSTCALTLTSEPADLHRADLRPRSEQQVRKRIFCERTLSTTCDLRVQPLQPAFVSGAQVVPGHRPGDHPQPPQRAERHDQRPALLRVLRVRHPHRRGPQAMARGGEFTGAHSIAPMVLIICIPQTLLCAMYCRSMPVPPSARPRKVIASPS